MGGVKQAGPGLGMGTFLLADKFKHAVDPQEGVKNVTKSLDKPTIADL